MVFGTHVYDVSNTVITVTKLKGPVISINEHNQTDEWVLTSYQSKITNLKSATTMIVPNLAPKKYIRVLNNGKSPWMDKWTDEMKEQFQSVSSSSSSSSYFSVIKSDYKVEIVDNIDQIKLLDKNDFPTNPQLLDTLKNKYPLALSFTVCGIKPSSYGVYNPFVILYPLYQPWQSIGIPTIHIPVAIETTPRIGGFDVLPTSKSSISGLSLSFASSSSSLSSSSFLSPNAFRFGSASTTPAPSNVTIMKPFHTLNGVTENSSNATKENENKNKTEALSSDISTVYKNWDHVVYLIGFDTDNFTFRLNGEMFVPFRNRKYPGMEISSYKSDQKHEHVGILGNLAMNLSELYSISTDSIIRIDIKGECPNGDISISKFNPSSTTHEGIQCDYCNVFPIVGDRYHCIGCKSNFDLCKSCHYISRSSLTDGPFCQTIKVTAPLHDHEKCFFVLLETAGQSKDFQLSYVDRK